MPMTVEELQKIKDWVNSYGLYFKKNFKFYI